MYRALQRFFDRTPDTDDSARLLRAVVLLLLGLSVGTGVAAADIYLHRGIESSTAPPYVLQSTGRELSINVDLLAYQPDQIEQIGQALQSNGYRYVRQTFSWANIEPVRDDYVWERYDTMVETMATHNIQIIAVLAHSPGWARLPGQESFADAPPALVSDYSDFVEEVVRRYQGKVQYFQVWDMPNRQDRWGGQVVKASDYLRLLAEAFNSVRTVNSEAKVLAAEMDPSYAGGSTGADLSFLRALYRAGGASFFDILAIRIDGGSSSPYDRRVRADHENFSRAILFRELTTDQGDDQKPIWITHFGWNAGPGGPVTRQEQSDFILAGVKRAMAEWPWLGQMFSWSLLPDPSLPGEAGYSMLEPDGTGTPAFAALAEYENEGSTAVAATGFVPMDSPPVTYSGNWDDQHLNHQTLKTTAEIGASATLQFRGTGVIALLRISPSAGPILATIDGAPIPGWPVQDGASFIDLASFQAEDLSIPLAEDLADRTHVLKLTLAERGQLTIGGLVISRNPPLLWPVIILIVMAVGIVAAGLRDIVYVIAIHSEALQPRRGVDLRPRLPRLPDWQPSRRF